jgi:diaminohydroxyphosphoribosylaminopyrimidine deaminase/5-amino-6-(5-phosphoribosylamino)uracil reductase
MSFQEKYMFRCIELALAGLGSVSPNPLVGCVVVHEDRIIGEGYHIQYGKPHAEVNAITSVQDKSLLTQAELYVSLEPCSHWGKTPPCVDLIIENKIPRVIIGAQDPYEEVNGRGIEILRNAGIEVVTNVLEDECRELNKRFFTYETQQRPYIILKWAETADGFIAREDHSSKWISSMPSRLLVHKWRSEEDAIMVGTNTAIYDNPQLTSRDISGKNPLRVVLDRNNRIPAGHHLFNSEEATLVFTGTDSDNAHNVSFIKADFDSPDLLQIVLANLYALRVQSLIVEGGSRLLQSFIDQDLWDEARIFRSNAAQFGKGIQSPQLTGKLTDTIAVDTDILYTYRNKA